MIQTLNSIIQAKLFVVISICGILLVRKKQTSKVLFQHETIHTKQMQELLYVFFYLAYGLEWSYRLIFTKDSLSHQAYMSISFEKEAYAHQAEAGYLQKRKHFAQWRKI